MYFIFNISFKNKKVDKFNTVSASIHDFGTFPICLTLFILDTSKQVHVHTLANSEDPDEMPHKAAFYQGLHC